MVDQLKLSQMARAWWSLPANSNANCNAERLRGKANKEKVTSEKLLPQPNDGHVLFTEFEVKSALRSKEFSNWNVIKKDSSCLINILNMFWLTEG